MLQHKDLYTIESFAETLGISVPTASRIAKSGEVKTLSDGRRALIPRDELEKYLMERNLITAPKDHPRLKHDKPSITALSFFSGALGLDLGMERAGIESMLFCEFDKKCRMTIEANRPYAALLGDITQLSPEKVREYAGLDPSDKIDVVFGGPPCQAFSTAGARRAFEDSRGNVFLKYLNLANDLDPTYLVIENVRGLLSTSWPTDTSSKPIRGGALYYILDRLYKMGFKVSFELYNAANFGAPQIRERVVLIAKKGSKVAKLTPTHSNDKKWGLPSWITFGEATSDLTSCHHTDFPEKRAKYLQLLGEGQYWRDLPESVQPEAMGKAYTLSGGKTGFYRRIRYDKPCPTLVTSPTMPATYLCHPSEIRPLSVEEYKRVQGFPDDWRICGDLADQYKQIGNAVPIALGEAIAKTIIADMKGISMDSKWSSFPYSRYKRTNEDTWSVG